MASLRHGAMLCLLVTAFLCTPVQVAEAINVVLDYTYDTYGFFGTGNPEGAVAGAQAKDALESVADFYSGILTDTFSEIRTPDPFNSSEFGGMWTWSWSLNFSNPSTASSVSISNPTIAEDEYRIYVGARSIAGSTLGVGGPGGFGRGSSGGGGFTSAEVAQINQIQDDFASAVDNRGESGGFARWGGAVTFDNDSSTSWHYDHTTSPASGKSDFFSIAIHEIGHALGLGTSDNWNNWVSGTNYNGPDAVSEFGGLVPLQCNPDCGHWASGTTSVVLGTSEPQEAALDPEITNGTRKLLTALDAAALKDIGWEVTVPAVASADYNGDGYVDAADLATLINWYGVSASGNANGDADGDGDTDGADFLAWQQQFTGPPPTSTSVPEPTSGCLLLFAFVVASRRRHRLRGF